jgi:hypothetical protein
MAKLDAFLRWKIRFVVFLAALTLAVLASGISPLARTSMRDKEIMVGRVLAEIDRPAGAGVGPLWRFFIFGVESSSANEQTKPVLIRYVFHNWKADGPPPASFYDYSRLYELQVVRDAKCDEAVSTLAIVKNETEDRKSLPPSPGIWFLNGTPRDAVKSDMVLPCYVLSRGNYRIK